MPDASLPSVSVVMPVRNEAATITETLDSTLAQDYPGALEVVVADGMSEDGTRELVEDLARRNERLRVVDNPARITPAGLNAAIRTARGAVVVRCDGHAVLPPDYVRRAVAVLEGTGAEVVGGVQEARGATFVQRAIALGMSTPFGVGDARFHYGGAAGPADTVYLGVYRREALERVGLFDEELVRSQDSDVNFRIRSSGGLVWFDPDLRVAYRPRSNLGGLWQQYLASGRWKREVLRRRPGSLRWRQLAPPALVAGLGVSGLFLFTPWWSLGLAVPALYGAELTFAALWTGLRRRDPAALLLPLVLPLMHIGWGLGFLWPFPLPARREGGG